MTAQLSMRSGLGGSTEKSESCSQGHRSRGRPLAAAPEADGSFEDRWEGIAQRMKDLREDIKPEDFEQEQLATLLGRCSTFVISSTETALRETWTCVTSLMIRWSASATSCEMPSMSM